jgi:hypothetical protein
MIVTLVPELANHMSSADCSGSRLKISDPQSCFDHQINNCFKEHACACSKTTIRDIISINVGGMIFQTKRSTLKRFPETLLGIAVCQYTLNA